MIRTATVSFAALLMSSGAMAQPVAPSCDDDIYRAFDFWLGEWEVFDVNGNKAGDNRITSQENGCLLLEEWTSAQGVTGQSYNFYDTGLEKWRQVWVSVHGSIDYSGGINEDGAMVLEGESAYRTGVVAPFKGTWTLQEDGSVRQHFEQYDAEKEEWVDAFIGIYRKKGA